MPQLPWSHTKFKALKLFKV